MQENTKRRLRPVMIASLVLAIIVPAIASASAERSTAGTRSAASPALGVYRLGNRPGQLTLEAQKLRRKQDRAEIHRHWLRQVRRHRAWLREQRRRRLATARAAGLASQTQTSSSPVSYHSGGVDWYAIAMCESSGNWSINSGNGYWGGLQFSPHTWYAYGGGYFSGSGSFPYSASYQIAVAERILASQGPGAWPNCFI